MLFNSKDGEKNDRMFNATIELKDSLFFYNHGVIILRYDDYI